MRGVRPRDAHAHIAQLRSEHVAAKRDSHELELTLQQQRNRELGEVSGRLLDLRGLEIEALRSTLEESHRMLAHDRDALESEHAERWRAARTLDRERQRTRHMLEALWQSTVAAS